MRNLLLILGCASLLAGCSTPPPRDASGTWINQAAIDAAVAGTPLREALLAYGPNLEWQLDPANGTARLSNGFEVAEGRLRTQPDGQLRVIFASDDQDRLSLERDSLVQAPSASWPEQRFARSSLQLPPGAPTGSRFEYSLYQAYLSGTWLIEEGLGQGGIVLFNPDGRLEGLPGAERYGLCLAGDCAAMTGEQDSMWLQLGEQGQVWIFEREQNQLRLFDANNAARPDEVPDYRKGELRWRLLRD
jgi:hypothetical protein